MQIDIDGVCPNDRPRMLEVWEASVRATHHFLTEEDIVFFRPFVEQAVASGIQIHCVRDTQGAVTGFAGVEGNKLEMLFIDPGWRGRGAGSALLDHAVNELGVVEVDVNEQNSQAVGFYRHKGFRTVNRSEVDGLGRPFPLLHLRLDRPSLFT